MPRRKTYDGAAIDALLDRQHGTASHRQLIELGMPMSTIMGRIGLTGPWQKMAPGVILSHLGTPTLFEKLHAGQVYCKDGSVLTADHALALQGVEGLTPGWPAQFLIPHGRHRQARDLARAERTLRMPDELVVVEGLHLAPILRSTVDAARLKRDLSAVRSLVAAVIQQRLLTVEQLTAEVHAAARQGTLFPRETLREVGDGIRSVAEGCVKKLFDRSGIPRPIWNAQLMDAGGHVIAVPDAYWPEHRTVLEIDSVRWHLDPQSWMRTQRKQRLYGSLGLLHIAVAPQDAMQRPEAFLADVRATLERGLLLPPSSISFRRPA